MIFARQIDGFLPEYQQHLVSILNDFGTLCRRHNLSWWLESGSLLGHVRHNGFIPWDDDVDIGMPIADYNKMREILESDTDFMNKYNIVTESENFLYWGMTKVVSNSYLVLDSISSNGQINNHIGAFIDIFPYEDTNYSGIAKFLCRKKRKNLGFKRPILDKVTMYKFLKHYRTKLYYIIADKFLNLLNKMRVNNGIYLLRTHYNVILKKEDIYPLRDVDWCGIKVKIPNNPHNYLVAMFGKNYMQLPPESKRTSHATLIVKK